MSKSYFRTQPRGLSGALTIGLVAALTSCVAPMDDDLEAPAERVASVSSKLDTSKLPPEIKRLAELGSDAASVFSDAKDAFEVVKALGEFLGLWSADTYDDDFARVQSALGTIDFKVTALHITPNGEWIGTSRRTFRPKRPTAG